RLHRLVQLDQAVEDLADDRRRRRVGGLGRIEGGRVGAEHRAVDAPALRRRGRPGREQPEGDETENGQAGDRRGSHGFPPGVARGGGGGAGGGAGGAGGGGGTAGPAAAGGVTAGAGAAGGGTAGTGMAGGGTAGTGTAGGGTAGAAAAGGGMAGAAGSGGASIQTRS